MTSVVWSVVTSARNARAAIVRVRSTGLAAHLQKIEKKIRHHIFDTSCDTTMKLHSSKISVR